jgi:hypothetical protein
LRGYVTINVTPQPLGGTIGYRCQAYTA